MPANEYVRLYGTGTKRKWVEFISEFPSAAHQKKILNMDQVLWDPPKLVPIWTYRYLVKNL
jgi:hypothetical protein